MGSTISRLFNSQDKIVMTIVGAISLIFVLRIKTMSIRWKIWLLTRFVIISRLIVSIQSNENGLKRVLQTVCGLFVLKFPYNIDLGFKDNIFVMLVSLIGLFKGDLSDSDPIDKNNLAIVRDARIFRDKMTKHKCIAKTKEIKVKARDGQHDIRVKCYLPENYQDQKNQNILVQYHGGGFVIGSPESHDKICDSLCLKSNILVASVDYRMAPEWKQPVAVHDSFDALVGIIKEFSPSKLFLGGDSAGGNLTAVVSILAREQKISLTGQIAIYPSVVAQSVNGSAIRNAQGPVLTLKSLHWFFDTYIGADTPQERLQKANEWMLSPLLAPSYKDLPPALVIVATYDPLQDDGIQYAEKLKLFDVKVTTKEFPSFHGFFGKGTYADSSIDCVSKWINKMILDSHL